MKYRLVIVFFFKQTETTFKELKANLVKSACEYKL